MGIANIIVKFFQGGGEFMIPIAVVLAIGLAIALERWIYLTLAAQRNRRVWGEIVPLVQNGAMQLKVIAQRKAGFKAPITLEIIHSAPGVTNASDYWKQRCPRLDGRIVNRT